MKDQLPDLDEATKQVLLRVVISDFTQFISTCTDDSFLEFFRTTDITQTSFFNDVMYDIEQILDAYWWKACDFLAEKTEEIQKSIFFQPRISE